MTVLHLLATAPSLALSKFIGRTADAADYHDRRARTVSFTVMDDQLEVILKAASECGVSLQRIDGDAPGEVLSAPNR